jgi:hypothetical protein
MGKKRALRDFLIIFLALVGIFLMTFGSTFIEDKVIKIIIIIMGSLSILVSIIISVTRLLIK